ncbi:hypothetical protein MMC10_009316 [Thelotrema lepadinum]|nr:hypothetical protein [Thelotrema lepadinum]
MVVPTASAAVPAPSGESTDFNAPNELWQWNILCQSLCLGIPGILWMLRLYVRVWIKRVWIFEDYLTVLSYVSSRDSIIESSAQELT